MHWIVYIICQYTVLLRHLFSSSLNIIKSTPPKYIPDCCVWQQSEAVLALGRTAHHMPTLILYWNLSIAFGFLVFQSFVFCDFYTHLVETSWHIKWHSGSTRSSWIFLSEQPITKVNSEIYRYFFHEVSFFVWNSQLWGHHIILQPLLVTSCRLA